MAEPPLRRAARTAVGAIGQALTRASVAPSTKLAPPRQAQDAGWTTVSGGVGTMGPAARAAAPHITDPLRTYGGTVEASAWVYACVTRRAQALSGYPWQLINPYTRLPIADNGRKPRGSETTAFEDLLETPWERATYFDLTELVVTDLDLCGDTFWLKDEVNALGQPKTLRRLLPSRVQIAVDSRDEEVGYVYTLRNGLQVPFLIEEVMHLKYPNPLNEHYGMGIVEALIRSVNADISQHAHVTAFFDQGAHLSGVLTVPETMGQDEFERLKQQYEEEFARSNNSFRVLIAEQATSYTPMTGGPAVLGVVDLQRLNKDEILSGFGVPEQILGGVSAAAGQSLEDAWAIFYGVMVPLAKRYSLGISQEVADFFNVGFSVMPKQSDTATAKAERARKFVGIGATIDDMREEGGLKRLNQPGVTDVPLIPQGLIPALPETMAADRVTGGAPGGNPNAQPNGGGQPTGGPESDKPDAGGDREGEDGKPSEGDARSLLPPVWDDAILGESKRRTLAVLAPGPDPILDAPPPPLPQRVAARRERSLAELTVRARAGLVPFFIAQRDRVLDSLSDFGATRGANLRSAPKRKKSELSPHELWNHGEERDQLRMVLHSVSEQGMRRGFDDVCDTVDEQAEFDVKGEEVDDFLNDMLDVLCEPVRMELYEKVGEGLRRNYSVSQIASGYGAEAYGGVLGVYDTATTKVADAAADEVARASWGRGMALACLALGLSAVPDTR